MAAILVLAACALPAAALCVYPRAHFEKSSSSDFGGRLYAKTTIADEFSDAALVIRGTVMSTRDMNAPVNVPDAHNGVEYQVRVDRVFKGNAPRIVIDYSERNSGGFYLNQGTDYLLFLNPLEKRNRWVVGGSTSAFEVNYSCGQSQPWSQVSVGARHYLVQLSRAP